MAVTLAVMAVAAVAAGLFLPHQALWVDETTQLSGLGLHPAELFRWLIHPKSQHFGVPADRMPPLSYWIGWLWSRFFGLNERSLRWCGVTCAAAAAGLVCSAARRAFGIRAGLFAGLFLALSPNVCVTAVEIRAYPLFLLTTAGALRALVVLMRSPAEDSNRGAWIGLTAWLIVGMYVHFFGALFAAVVVTGLATNAVLKRQPFRPVVMVATVVAVGIGGLAPFVIASAGLSGASSRDRLHEVLQLVYRLVGHPAAAVFPLVTVLLFGSAGTLLLAGWRLHDRARTLNRFLLFVLIAGIAISSAADFVVAGFTAAKVSYATWALPLSSMALAAPLAHSNRRWSRIALAAAVLFAACESVGIAQLARNGDYFAHGPQRHLQQVLDGLKARHPAVIHADPTGDYAAAYFPLRFANGPALTQFVFAEPGMRPPLGIPLEISSDQWSADLRGYSSLVVVRSQAESARQLADQIRHGDRAFGPSRLVSKLATSGEWNLRAHWLFVSFVAADVSVFERAGTGP